jgi:hypothetical protein
VTVTALAVLAGALPAERSWQEMLLEAVAPEFRVDVYHAVPGDPVLHGPTCAVGGCPGRGVNRSLGLNAAGENRSAGTRFRGFVCLAHVEMWRRDGEPPINVWVRQSAQALQSQAVPERCGAPRCTRSTASNGLCGAHRRRWTQAGRPDVALFLADAGAVLAGGDRCLIAGCRFSSAGQTGFCDGHGCRFRNARATRPRLTAEGYLGYLREARRVSAPRYDMSALAPLLRLEMGLALQSRMLARRAQMTPLIFGQVVRWLGDQHAGSILERGEAYWLADAQRRFPVRASRSNPLGWLRFVRQCSLRLREQHSTGEVWQWDTWPTDRLDVDGRWSHQPTRRIYFSEIDPRWLRELVKRWAKWRLTSATKSPASISCTTSSIRRFCRWAETRGTTLTATGGDHPHTAGGLPRRRVPARPLPRAQEQPADRPQGVSRRRPSA